MGSGQDHRRRPGDAARARLQRLSQTRSVLVPPERVGRWFDNFASRHAGSELTVRDGRLHARGGDGALAVAELPFDRSYDGRPEVSAFAEAVSAPASWGILLVRKGGFAVARLDGDSMLVSKVGQRHVQGRTKAGGQSQQRFARRRDNQARQAYEAAADHAHRILVREARPALDALVCGGDRSAVEAVLSDPRLTALAGVRTSAWLAVPDPRRGVLEKAVTDALSVRLELSCQAPERL